MNRFEKLQNSIDSGNNSSDCFGAGMDVANAFMDDLLYSDEPYDVFEHVDTLMLQLADTHEDERTLILYSFLTQLENRIADNFF